MTAADKPAYPAGGTHWFYAPEDSNRDEIKAAVEGMRQKFDGMTLREHYAGLAMQGLMINFGTDEKLAAVLAVRQADALIAELSKERT